jgi:hypothetical protein
MTAMELAEDFTDTGLGALEAAVSLFAQRRQEARMIEHYNQLVNRYNALLDEHRRLARRYNRLVDERDQLVSDWERYRRFVARWLPDWAKDRP